MAKSLTQLSLFLSGTAQTDAEKQAIRVVVEEVNRMLERTHSLRLDVKGWPTNFRPGVNVHPQGEIDRQVGEYDIYLGLLGTRFGTPTPNAGSGTEEEFEAALARFRRDPRSIRLLFYFKRDNDDPYALDLEQFARVKAFRDGLTGRGVLFRDFRTTTEFASIVREHLSSLIADEWTGSGWREIAGISTPIQPTLAKPEVAIAMLESSRVSPSVEVCSGEDPDSDVGLLDHIITANQSADHFTVVLRRMTATMAAVGEKAAMRAAAIDSLQVDHANSKRVGGNRDAQQLLSRFRDLVDESAEDLEEFAGANAADLEEYRITRSALFTHLSGMVHERSALAHEGDDSEREALLGMRKALIESGAAIASFQNVLRDVPALTGRYKRAKRQASTVLGAVAAEWSLTLQDVERLLSTLGGGPGVSEDGEQD